MLNGTKGIYTLDTGEDLLWRYSLDEVNWNSDQIQGIDYSTMLYGLAADKFGVSFFTNNNNYDFPTGTETVLHEAYFESGWNGWSDGGSDCYRMNDANLAYENSYSIRLRDNSGTASSMTSQYFNLSSYDEVKFEFFFYPNSMESGEDFWLQYNDGSGFRTIKTWRRGTDFNNNNFYYDSVTLNGSAYNLVTNGRFRLRCDASGNGDQVYIDQIKITGIGGYSSFTPALKNEDSFKEETKLSEKTETRNDFTIYPNPAEDLLHIKTLKGGDVTYRIIDALGQTIRTGTTSKSIQVNDLQSGMYFMEIQDGSNKMIKRFIKK